MIKDGFITYPGADSTLHNWRPQNAFLFEFSVAALTTVLVYQLTAIAFDLVLGLKKKGQVTVSDIAIFISGEDASLLSVIINLGCEWCFARWRAHGFMGKCSAHGRKQRPSNHTGISKLVFILVLFPIVNIGGVLLNIEITSYYTFKDVGFRGVDVVLNESFIPDYHNVGRSGETCTLSDTRYGRHDEALGVFRTCLSGMGNFLKDEDITSVMGTTDPSATRLFVTTSSGGGITAAVWLRRGHYYATKSFHLTSDKHTYRLKQNLNASDGEKILLRGVKAMLAFCPSNYTRSSIEVIGTSSATIAQPWNKWKVALNLSCYEFSAAQARIFPTHMVNAIQMVTSERFDLLRKAGHPDLDDAYEEIEGFQLPFLKRSKGALSFLVLLIFTLASVFVRLLLSLFVNNDVHMGIETILKDEFQVKCCDSMLQCTEKIHFRVADSANERFYEKESKPHISMSSDDTAEEIKHQLA